MIVNHLEIKPDEVCPIEWDKPEITESEIEVRAVMTGVCRSDIDMMLGKFGPLPVHMHGHEGLGQVTKVGKDLEGSISVGDFVATRGEPAYADYYNVRKFEFVKVPEAHPRYIIEPVACGVNLIEQEWTLIEARIKKLNSRVLVYGSGFLAYVAYAALKDRISNFPEDIKNSIAIDVVGKSNRNLWDQAGVVLHESPSETYDLIIDLKDDLAVWDGSFCRNNSVIVAAVEKVLNNVNLGSLLWKAVTVVFPSPRTDAFYNSMIKSVEIIQNGKINIDSFWTKGYERSTSWQQAFEDSLTRPAGFSRAYIIW